MIKLTNILLDAKQSRLAHGSSKKTYGEKEVLNLKKVRKGQKVVYTGDENPSKKFEGETGVILSQAPGQGGRYVIVLIKGKKYQMHKNDLGILESISNKTIIESHLGQWEYPGRITRIPDNKITMQPDPRTGKPIQHTLLIIGDQSGERQIGVPGGPDLVFPNDQSVTEYPIKKNWK